MKTKQEIVANWLPRYTKRNLEDFGEYILLTNFNKYVEIFANQFDVPILGRDANMISATAEGITMINFGMGSPNAAIIMDLLGAIHPKACLFLGKCGGIDKKNQIGDLILPIAAIRGEGTSNDYLKFNAILGRDANMISASAENNHQLLGSPKPLLESISYDPQLQCAEIFAEKFNVPILGRDANMISASAEGITIINFGMGSPNAAIIMDLLSAISPKACLFLGKCGGIDKKNKIGDLILPIAAIRGEGTSNDYFPPEVPSLPAFMLQRAVSSAIRDYARDYWTGTVYTTNRRIWEHDDAFKEYLKKTRAMAVDMETATLFSCGFANHIPTGALLLVSDQPMIPEGVKTDKSDNIVTKNYVEEHVEIGIASLRMIIDEKKTVKHLKFDW